jgi:uncharacterized protein YgbK (DUF1537 family)
MSELVQLPQGVLVAWYGDDFTGSSAVLEVLTFGGLPSVLFLDVPTEAQLAAFSHCRGVGIAGIARSKSPAWMEANLPRYFRALRRIGAPIAQYKVCSTFDSSADVGSIGKALNIGAPMLGGSWHPLIVAAPPVRRYQAFGNLFAGFNEKTHRLDRHPTMSRHPVTPMTEADVRLHLSFQTEKAIGLVDLLALRSQNASDALQLELASGAEIVVIDAVDEADLAAAGRLIWENRVLGCSPSLRRDWNMRSSRTGARPNFCARIRPVMSVRRIGSSLCQGHAPHRLRRRSAGQLSMVSRPSRSTPHWSLMSLPGKRSLSAQRVRHFRPQAMASIR